MDSSGDDAEEDSEASPRDSDADEEASDGKGSDDKSSTDKSDEDITGDEAKPRCLIQTALLGWTCMLVCSYIYFTAAKAQNCCREDASLITHHLHSLAQLELSNMHIGKHGHGLKILRIP